MAWRTLLIALVMGCASPARATLVKRADGSTFRSGAISITDYVTKAISPSVSLAKASLDGTHGPTSSTRFDRIYFITAGTATFRAGSSTFDVAAGDCVFVPKRVAITIVGRVEYLVVNAPAFEPGYDR